MINISRTTKQTGMPITQNNHSGIAIVTSILLNAQLMTQVLTHCLYMPPSDREAEEVRLLHLLVGENSLVKYVEPPDMLDELFPSHRELKGVSTILDTADVVLIDHTCLDLEVVLIDYVSDCCHKLLFLFFLICKDTKNFAYTQIFLVSLTEIFRRAK